MCWFRKKAAAGRATIPPPGEEIDTEAEKLRRISSLTTEETKAFQWFKQGYTARWTAETMMLDRRTARSLFGSVFRKLGAVDEQDVLRIYARTPLNPEDIPPEDEL